MSSTRAYPSWEIPPCKKSPESHAHATVLLHPASSHMSQHPRSLPVNQSQKISGVWATALEVPCGYSAGSWKKLVGCCLGFWWGFFFILFCLFLFCEQKAKVRRTFVREGKKNFLTTASLFHTFKPQRNLSVIHTGMAIRNDQLPVACKELACFAQNYF